MRKAKLEFIIIDFILRLGTLFFNGTQNHIRILTAKNIQRDESLVRILPCQLALL